MKFNRWFVIGGLLFIDVIEQTSIVSVEFNSRKPNTIDWWPDVCWLSIKYAQILSFVKSKSNEIDQSGLFKVKQNVTWRTEKCPSINKIDWTI